MASPSRSFSALLNSSTASGLSSDYPGQVEGWVLKCTKKASRFNEKQKAYLDARFAIVQATGKKLDGDIVVREMRGAFRPGARFLKVPKTFRTRKAIRKTPTRLFCKAGFLIYCKGNKN